MKLRINSHSCIAKRRKSNGGVATYICKDPTFKLSNRIEINSLLERPSGIQSSLNTPKTRQSRYRNTHTKIYCIVKRRKRRAMAELQCISVKISHSNSVCDTLIVYIKPLDIVICSRSHGPIQRLSCKNKSLNQTRTSQQCTSHGKLKLTQRSMA